YTEVSRLNVPETAVDAGEVLRDTLDGLAGAMAESGAQIEYDPMPVLRVNGAHLKQLFQNLIGNANQYPSPHRPPKHHLRADRNDQWWTISVVDNGIGIDPDYRDQIFGLFKRLHSSDEYSGTGIGLAICQRIVERYHGTIRVESSPGEGSTFLFTLPA